MKEYGKENAYEGREVDLHKGIIKLLKYYNKNLYFFHVANERKTEIAINKKGMKYTPEGSRLKSLGVLAGIPDIIIINPTKKYNGLAVEIKTKTGRLRHTQLISLENFEKHGWFTAVVYSYEGAQKLLEDYFKT